MPQTWSPQDYQNHAAFVPELGLPLLGWLAPSPGERILDLGCGDGTLTAQIVATGAEVTGVDSSPAMVEAARQRGIDAHVGDATRLPYEAEFDAVFSNAALHWVLQADAALHGIACALKPGGRFVAELGGYLNVAAIAVAFRAVFAARRLPLVWPWDLPTPDEYAVKARAAGLSIVEIALVPRPTPLPTGIEGWLTTFCGSIFSTVPQGDREKVTQEIVDLLRPSLCDSSGNWTADYVRLRVKATKSM